MSAPAISASLVKELRDQTGAGMMDAKRALVETGGDIEAARVLLRERGLANAAKRAGRETTEGLVGYRISDSHGTMVAVGCETEPVSNNDEFQTFAKKVLDAVDAEVALDEVLGEGGRMRRAASGAGHHHLRRPALEPLGEISKRRRESFCLTCDRLRSLAQLRRHPGAERHHW